MLIAYLWSKWTDPTGEQPDLPSFAAIMDEPKVAAAGHNRTIINIRSEHVVTWLNSDEGLNDFARREFGKPLSALTPMQAATTVAITRAPSIYLRDRGQLEQRANWLLEASTRANTSR